VTSASKASSTISRAAAFIGSHSSKSPSSDCLVRFRLCSLAGIRRVSWIFLALCFCVACNESPAHRAYLRGIDDESNQSFETRLSHLSEAVRLEPNNAEFLKARGMLYFDNQKYDLAFADLDRSAKFEDRGERIESTCEDSVPEGLGTMRRPGGTLKGQLPFGRWAASFTVVMHWLFSRCNSPREH